MIQRRRFLVTGSCGVGAAVGLTCLKTLAEDWPQWRGSNRDGRWREPGILEKLPDGQLPLRWDVPIGAGYSGPVVANGRVYVTDKQEGSPAIERILCFDENTGESLWKQEYAAVYKVGYPAGPRASVTVDQGMAFSLGAMGHVVALDAKEGTILWQRDLNADYQIGMPAWGIANSPLAYGELLIIPIGGAEGASVIGLDRRSGQERWRALDDRVQYSAPILIQQAGEDVVVVWTGDHLAGLDPKSGQAHWQVPFKPSKMPIGVPTPVVEGERIFISSFYDGSMMLRLPKDSLSCEKIWHIRGQDEKRTDALHCMIGTPIFQDGFIYGVDSYGQLRCLDAETGKRLWEDNTATPQERWSTIHMVQREDKVWMFNELGEIIVAKLSPDGYQELSRSKLIEPTYPQLYRRGNRGVCWAHPAFANKHIIARSDERLVSASVVMVPS
jgi:outer membrane protein assembly factor BamB